MGAGGVICWFCHPSCGLNIGLQLGCFACFVLQGRVRLLASMVQLIGKSLKLKFKVNHPLLLCLVFPGLLIVGVILIVIVSGRTNSGVLVNLGSNLDVVIYLIWDSGIQLRWYCFSYSLLNFLAVRPSRCDPLCCESV